MAEKHKARRRKTRRRRSRSEVIHYVLAIAEWDWSLSFGVNQSPSLPGPFWDFRHLLVRGDLLLPVGLTTNRVELTILPDATLNEAARTDHQPTNIGALQLRRGSLTGWLPLPCDALSPVLQMLIGERFRFLVIRARPFRYGRADVLNDRLEQTLDEDGLPDTARLCRPDALGMRRPLLDDTPLLALAKARGSACAVAMREPRML